MVPRRVAVVTEGRAGPEIMRWAAHNLLQPADEVHVLHVLAKSDRNAGSAVPPGASAVGVEAAPSAAPDAGSGLGGCVPISTSAGARVAAADTHM